MVGLAATYIAVCAFRLFYDGYKVEATSISIFHSGKFSTPWHFPSFLPLVLITLFMSLSSFFLPFSLSFQNTWHCFILYYKEQKSKISQCRPLRCPLVLSISHSFSSFLTSFSLSFQKHRISSSSSTKTTKSKISQCCCCPVLCPL